MPILNGGKHYAIVEKKNVSRLFLVSVELWKVNKLHY